MKKKFILNNKKDIDFLFETGKYASNNDYTIKYLPVSGETKFLFTVSSKKYKNATDRNLIKRRMKMIISSLKSYPKNFHIAIIYKNDTIINFEIMKNNLESIIRTIKNNR
jgi:ribonuclease P protein component